MYYSAETLKKIHGQYFQFIEIEESNHILGITLNRPEKKNALHPIMIREIAYAIEYAMSNKNIWAVVFKANGDVFCSGADLNAMSGQSIEISSTIPSPKEEIIVNNLFLFLTKPSIAIIEADVYAGGLLFIAACTYVVSKPIIRFSLPEVKRGLFPFQVMGELCKILPAKIVLDWCVFGKTYTAKELTQYGLVTHLTEYPREEAQQLINELFKNSPYAIQKGIEAFKRIQINTDKDNGEEYLQHFFLQTIQSKDAKEGLAAFKEKRSPKWTGE